MLGTQNFAHFSLVSLSFPLKQSYSTYTHFRHKLFNEISEDKNSQNELKV